MTECPETSTLYEKGGKRIECIARISILSAVLACATTPLLFAQPEKPPKHPNLPEMPAGLPKPGEPGGPPDESKLFYQLLEKARHAGGEEGKSLENLLDRWAWNLEGRLGPGDQIINVAAMERMECTRFQGSPEYSKNKQVAKFLGAWRPIGPFRYTLARQGSDGGLGRVNNIAFPPSHPNSLLAGSATGALWRSDDLGLSWRPLTDGFGVSGIAFDSKNPEIIYYLTGDGNGFGGNAYYKSSIGVMKSLDDGKTWSLLGPLTDQGTTYYGYDLVADPKKSDVLFVATSIGLFGTRDGGKTWTQLLKNYSYDIEFHPTDPSIVYVATQFQVFRSDQGGAEGTFQEVAKFPAPPGNQGFYSASRVELAVTPAAPDVVYAVFGGTSGLAGIYRSDDAGKSFSLRSSSPNVLGEFGYSRSAVTWFALALAASPLDENDLYVASFNIWRSRDGGVTWTQETYRDQTERSQFYKFTHNDVHALDFYRSALYAASDGGVFMKPIGQDTWADLSSGLPITQIYRMCGQAHDADVLFFGAQDNGNDWLKESVAVNLLIGDGTTCLINPTNREEVYFASSGPYLFKTTDGGHSLTSIAPPGAQNAPWVLPLTTLADDFNTLFACYEDVWKTTDGGTTWTAISQGDQLGPKDSKNDSCVQIVTTPKSASSGGYLYVAKETAVYRTTLSATGEGDWENITANLCGDKEETPHISDLAVNPLDPEEAWVTFSGFHQGEKVYKGVRSKNGEFEWVNVSGTLPNVPANTLLFDGGKKNGVYVGMDCGVYYLNDELSDWIPFSGPGIHSILPGVLPSVMVQDLLLQKSKHTGKPVLRAGTFSWGVWESPPYPTSDDWPGPPGPPGLPRPPGGN